MTKRHFTMIDISSNIWEKEEFCDLIWGHLNKYLSSHRLIGDLKKLGKYMKSPQNPSWLGVMSHDPFLTSRNYDGWKSRVKSTSLKQLFIKLSRTFNAVEEENFINIEKFKYIKSLQPLTKVTRSSPYKILQLS